MSVEQRPSIIKYGILATIVVVGACLVWYGIVPLQKNIFATMNHLQALLVNQDMRRASIAEVGELQKQRDDILSRKDRLETVIAKDHIVDLIQELELIAKETNNAIAINDQSQLLSLTKKATSKKKEESSEKTLLESLPSDQRIGILITLTGDYASVSHFLRKIESMKYQTDVVNIAFSFRTEENRQMTRSNMFASDAVTVLPPEPIAPSKRFQAVLDTAVYIHD